MMKTVIEMAREAGLIATEFGAVHGDMYHLERFAALVREDERENRQWRDLTDYEIEEIQNMEFSQNDWLWFYTRAVIAKFKENNCE